MIFYLLGIMDVIALPIEEYPQFMIDFDHRIVPFSAEPNEIYIRMTVKQLNKEPFLGKEVELILVTSLKKMIPDKIIRTITNILKEKLLDLFPFIIVFKKNAYIWDKNSTIDKITDKISLSLLEIPSFTAEITGMYINVNSNNVDNETIRTHFENLDLKLKCCLKKMNKRSNFTLKCLSLNKSAKTIMMKILKDFEMGEIVWIFSTFPDYINENWIQLVKKLNFLNIIILMSIEFNSYFNKRFLEEVENYGMPNKLKQEIKSYLIPNKENPITNLLNSSLFCYICLVTGIGFVQNCPHSTNSE